VFHLLVADVRDLGLATALWAWAAGVQRFNRPIAERERDESLCLSGKFG